MPVSRYSAPEFNPYDDDAPIEADEPAHWPAPRATGPLAASLSIPGSKSLTNRELVLAALAEGPGILRRPLHSRDTELMAQALRTLGADIATIDDGESRRFGADWSITPGELIAAGSIDTGLAGTVMRFIPPVAALAKGSIAFDGDESARRRPMRTTIESLRALGTQVKDDMRGTLPFSLHGTGGIEGGELQIDASASSQFVSGLLLAAPRFERGLHLRHVGEHLPSTPHIDMTIAALTARGVSAGTESEGVWRVEPGPIDATELTIEPDLSNAAPFLLAAVVAGGTVTIHDWPSSTTQVGAELLDLLAELGFSHRREGADLVFDGGAGVAAGGLAGFDVDLSRGGELAPAVVGLAALATSPSRITGIAHLRGHETDRLAALVAEITALGGDAVELPDGIAITPAPLHGGVWHSYEDHRMATTGALIGLAVDGVLVEDIGSTAKTLPEFPELWHELLGTTAHEDVVSDSDEGWIDLGSFASPAAPQASDD